MMLIINGVKTEAKKLNTTIVAIIIRANETVSSLLKTFLNILLKHRNSFRKTNRYRICYIVII